MGEFLLSFGCCQLFVQGNPIFQAPISGILDPKSAL